MTIIDETDGAVADLPGAQAVLPANPERTVWEKARRSYIGGSDAAAIAGLNPWKTRFQLWSEKSGLIEPENLDGKESVQWGSRLESVLVDHFADVTGMELVTPAGMYVSKSHPFMAASLDRLVRDATGLAILEVKTAGFMQARKWDSGVPEHYALQVHHYLAVTGLEKAHVAAFIGGQEFRLFEIERDESIIEPLIQLEADFAAMVEEGREPEVDGDASTGVILAKLHPAEEGKAIEVEDTFVDLLRELEDAKAAKKAAEEQAKLAENTIKKYMQEAEVAMLGGIPICTWKTSMRKGYTKEVESCEVRTLRPTPIEKLIKQGVQI